MSSSQFSRWIAVVLLVGCNAKLQVDPGASGGNGGASPTGVAGAAGTAIVPRAGAGGDDAGTGGSEPGGFGGDDCTFCAAGAVSAAGALGAAGSPVVGPQPGQRGQPCIPGGSPVEADGNPGKTTVTTLDRCGDGLVCDTTKHCSGVPNCPQSSGPCVIHGVALEDPNAGSGGSSAAGAGGAPPFAFAGSGGAGGGGEQAPLVAPEAGVLALANDDAHLYWIEYGTRDTLGNYQHDGALFSYGFADAKTTTLASNLPGPNALGITSGHAYVAVDGGPLIGSAAHAQLLRLPLTGGASELVQDAISPSAFASVGDQAFWQSFSGIYTVLPAAGATVKNLYGGYAQQLAVDASNVYYADSSSIFSLLQTGGASALVVTPGYTFALSGDSVYSVESPGLAVSMTLDLAPKTGGAWQRKHALGAGSPDRLLIIGDRYFVSAAPRVSDTDPFPDSKGYIETGLISSNDGPVRLVETSLVSASQRLRWTSTAQAVFWTDGSAILTRSVTGK